MADERQFIVEILNTQGVEVGRIAADRVFVVGSRITGATAQGAASIATNQGGSQSALVNTAVATSPSVIVRDASNLPVSSSAVTWEVTGGGGSISAGAANSTTNAFGIATLGSLWTLGTTAGANTIKAFSNALTNSPIGFVATGLADSVFSIQISRGTSQTTTPLGTFPSTLSVVVNDQFANTELSGTVDWFTTDSAGSFLQGADAGLGFVSTSISLGSTWNQYVAGTSASIASITARIGQSNTSARFDMTTVAGPAVSIAITAGDSQVATSSTTLPIDPTVFADDGYGNLVNSGNTFRYVVVTGSGNISRATSTPLDSVGSVEWKLGPAVGLNQLEVSLVNVSNSTVTFNASATAPQADTMALSTGNSQSGTVGTALALPWTVVVTGGGLPSEGQAVDFVSTDGTLSTAQDTSDVNGLADATLTLPTTAGAVTGTASANLTGSPINFAATAVADVANKWVIAVQPSSNADIDVLFASQPRVQLSDQYGNAVATAGVSCTAALASGTGALNGTKTVTTNSAGLAIFTNLSLSASGNKTISFSGTVTAATSNTVNVNPPFASQLAFTTQPSNVVVGNVISPSVVVAVQDSTGVIVPTATDSITLAYQNNAGGGTLGGTLTRNASAGLATFNNLTNTVVATGYTLPATSGALTGATSASYDVTAASGAHPNEPAGMTAVPGVERDFAALTEGVWGTLNDADATVVTPATDSLAAQFTRSTFGTALKVRYTSGLAGGTAPITVGTGTISPGKSEIYLDFDYIRDAAYVGHNSGINKVWFVCNHTLIGGVPFIFMTYGTGLNALKPGFDIQSCPPDVGGNGPGGAQVINSPTGIARDTKCRIEIYCKMNTVDGLGAANPDGILNMWVDGVLKVNRDPANGAAVSGAPISGGCAFRGTGGGLSGTQKIDLLRLSPTWGGSGKVQTPAGNLYIGYVYLSGKV